MKTIRQAFYAYVSVVFICCALAQADLKYTESSQVTGGAMVGMMKMASVFSKQARQSSGPTMTTQYLKGHKMRRDGSDGQSMIIDLDAKQIINIDNTKHTYAVMTFDQMRQMMEQQKARAQEQMAKESHQNPQKANIKITPKIQVTDGTGTRTILGVSTHEVKVDLEMLMEASDPNQPNQTGQVQTWMKSDEYVAPSLPGYDQFREFQQAMAKELDWVPGQMGQMFGGNLQVSTSMGELQKSSTKVTGFPLLQYISMGMGAPGQPNGANPNAASSQQQQPPSDSPDASSPSAAAAKALGGFLRRHKQAQDQNQSAGGGGAGPSAPPQASQPGSLMEMTVEVTALSTDPLDASLFAPPAGYTQVDASQALSAH
jgi:hypothetical protein